MFMTCTIISFGSIKLKLIFNFTIARAQYAICLISYYTLYDITERNIVLIFVFCTWALVSCQHMLNSQKKNNKFSY